jgi:hypothetical protein
MRRKHHKTKHVEGAEDRAVGERVSEHCVVASRKSGSERVSVGEEKGEGREGHNERMKETHITSPVWIVTDGAKRQHRRKIDRRARICHFSSTSLKGQEAGDARQMDVRERGQPLLKRSQKTPWVSQHGDKSFARSQV